MAVVNTDKGIVVGVVSDSHGLLRPEVIEALHGCDRILHAGDIGKPEVIQKLELLAPVTAIRGNVDRGDWADAWPETERFELQAQRFYMLHNLRDLDFDPGSQGIDVVISGHSHKPHQYRKDGVLYLNPGSIGPRRFSLPIALSRLILGETTVSVEMLTLG